MLDSMSDGQKATPDFSLRLGFRVTLGFRVRLRVRVRT